MLVLFVRLVRVKLRENFHILGGVTANLVLILATIVLVSLYAAALGASAFVYDYDAGVIVYWLFIPVDIVLLALLCIDLIVFVMVLHSVCGCNDVL